MDTVDIILIGTFSLLGISILTSGLNNAIVEAAKHKAGCCQPHKDGNRKL